ncbi:CBS domain-containing protein [Streptomyces griseofuscus]|uniref:CBS domain-containing protein n=1 Tax=Streptomyces griseofuscus TaxID=146922 RepID=UPI0034514100
MVREVMDVPAAHIRADLPYRDIARVLAREQAGALPVVEAEDQVVGVVSESDLLAKVAFEASGHRPRPIGRLRERRLHGVVRRDSLLQALIRDDAGIRAEVEATVEATCPPAGRDAVQVAVHDGIVELTGRMPTATARLLLAEIERIADVIEVKNLLGPGT